MAWSHTVQLLVHTFNFEIFLIPVNLCVSYDSFLLPLISQRKPLNRFASLLDRPFSGSNALITLPIWRAIIFISLTLMTNSKSYLPWSLYKLPPLDDVVSMNTYFHRTNFQPRERTSPIFTAWPTLQWKNKVIFHNYHFCYFVYFFLPSHQSDSISKNLHNISSYFKI